MRRGPHLCAARPFWGDVKKNDPKKGKNETAAEPQKGPGARPHCKQNTGNGVRKGETEPPQRAAPFFLKVLHTARKR